MDWNFKATIINKISIIYIYMYILQGYCKRNLTSNFYHFEKWHLIFFYSRCDGTLQIKRCIKSFWVWLIYIFNSIFKSNSITCIDRDREKIKKKRHSRRLGFVMVIFIDLGIVWASKGGGGPTIKKHLSLPTAQALTYSYSIHKIKRTQIFYPRNQMHPKFFSGYFDMGPLHIIRGLYEGKNFNHQPGPIAWLLIKWRLW